MYIYSYIHIYIYIFMYGCMYIYTHISIYGLVIITSIEQSPDQLEALVSKNNKNLCTPLLSIGLLLTFSFS